MTQLENEKPVYDATTNETPAGVIKKIIDQYFQGSDFTNWFFGSIALIAVFLLMQAYSKENVTFPYFTQFTFNDLLKVLILMFIILVLFKTFFNKIIVPLLIFLSSVLKFALDPIIQFFEKIPRNYNEEEWVADPLPVYSEKQKIYPQLRHRIPLEVRKFDFIRFDVAILGDYPHWRAGIFILGFDSSGDYVIHLYKDKSDPQLKTKMTKRIFNRGHIKESDKNLAVRDTQHFQFEVKSEGNNFYSLKINGEEIDRYKIPQGDFKIIDLGAWADDQPFKIQFKNIQFKG